MDLVITQDGREALANMLSTCDEVDNTLIKVLRGKKSGGFTYGELIDETADEVQDKRPEILKRLESFASSNLKSKEVTADTVVRYFGGAPHLEACFLLHKNFPDFHTQIDTTCHIMLPINEEGVYSNGPLRLEFKGISIPEKQDGILFAHLGKSFYVRCSKGSVTDVLSEQNMTPWFAEIVRELGTIDVKDILSKKDESCPL